MPNVKLSAWMDWWGGKCPVRRGTRVDVIFRCGEKAMNVHALHETHERDGDYVATCWGIVENSPVGMDIIKWRKAANV